ncbi:uncharacterized protein ASCRUDRAFT_121236 [Ascoidea rubescens DSM 1968]|uniref:Uncharacterized protein n=1 Tax=Ascoidea rubescens DSM 1968 TaxID=1344418 RepID=A0A1D2V9V9_9ASCO|nr:hypothetical protein ASCRUDRAFT_121236 [Ascoidea rubescens DSM 1968]ODV58441.1 hypothetical protein ASCRUDRAFT_121236 [Ascoidea rubescens DSM 1968]
MLQRKLQYHLLNSLLRYKNLFFFKTFSTISESNSIPYSNLKIKNQPENTLSLEDYINSKLHTNKNKNTSINTNLKEHDIIDNDLITFFDFITAQPTEDPHKINNFRRRIAELFQSNNRTLPLTSFDLLFKYFDLYKQVFSNYENYKILKNSFKFNNKDHKNLMNVAVNSLTNHNATFKLRYLLDDSNFQVKNRQILQERNGYIENEMLKASDNQQVYSQFISQLYSTKEKELIRIQKLYDLYLQFPKPRPLNFFPNHFNDFLLLFSNLNLDNFKYQFKLQETMSRRLMIEINKRKTLSERLLEKEERKKQKKHKKMEVIDNVTIIRDIYSQIIADMLEFNIPVTLKEMSRLIELNLAFNKGLTENETKLLLKMCHTCLSTNNNDDDNDVYKKNSDKSLVESLIKKNYGVGIISLMLKYSMKSRNTQLTKDIIKTIYFEKCNLLDILPDKGSNLLFLDFLIVTNNKANFFRFLWSMFIKEKRINVFTIDIVFLFKILKGLAKFQETELTNLILGRIINLNLIKEMGKGVNSEEKTGLFENFDEDNEIEFDENNSKDIDKDFHDKNDIRVARHRIKIIDTMKTRIRCVLKYKKKKKNKYQNLTPFEEQVLEEIEKNQVDYCVSINSELFAKILDISLQNPKYSFFAIKKSFEFAEKINITLNNFIFNRVMFKIRFHLQNDEVVDESWRSFENMKYLLEKVMDFIRNQYLLNPNPAYYKSKNFQPDFFVLPNIIKTYRVLLEKTTNSARDHKFLNELEKENLATEGVVGGMPADINMQHIFHRKYLLLQKLMSHEFQTHQ